MGIGQRLALLAGGAIVATAASAQPAGQKVTGPVAVYWMSAQTQTGFGMGGMTGGGPGGGRPSMSQIMGMMNGGGGAQHTLVLQLGSSRKPDGPPRAEHLPPAGLGVGQSVPLVTPQAPPAEPEDRPPVPREYQKPRGRMLIFWGCGEHAGPGQPVVIDFAQMTPEAMKAGKAPPGLEALSRGMGVRPMQPPSPHRNTTYGDWPNSESRAAVTGQSSLVGDHLVRGDYSPEIKFSLNPSQDFLGPLNLLTNAKSPSGSVQLGWNAVPGAEGYVASVVGGGQQDTVVLWTSAETQASAFALPDFLSPADISRLVASRSLMGPQTTSCTVPKEVADAARQGFLQLVAYGHEANFVYPPRPSDPKVAWNQQWQVKVRYRSATGGLLGMAMPGGDERGGNRGRRGGDEAGPPQSPQDAAAERRRGILKGLGGLIPH